METKQVIIPYKENEKVTFIRLIGILCQTGYWSLPEAIEMKQIFQDGHDLSVQIKTVDLKLILSLLKYDNIKYYPEDLVKFEKEESLYRRQSSIGIQCMDIQVNISGEVHETDHAGGSFVIKDHSLTDQQKEVIMKTIIKTLPEVNDRKMKLDIVIGKVKSNKTEFQIEILSWAARHWIAHILQPALPPNAVSPNIYFDIDSETYKFMDGWFR